MPSFQSPLDAAALKADFPALEQKFHGKPLVYLDNAATSQKPRQVIEAVSRYYETSNANVHRAIYALGERATSAYENARAKVAGFVGAGDDYAVVFTRGTTEAINLVAYAWGRYNVVAGDEIVISELEHHSNLIPWQLLCRDTGAHLKIIPLAEDQQLNLEAAREIITPQTKLLAIGHQSNALGNINAVDELTALARSADALVLIDGAQAVPHFPINIDSLGPDFYAFSGHKMLGPTGVGGLVARRQLLEDMEPFQGGGEMISLVTWEGSTWNEVPYKFEAGTPNIAQAVGLGAAIDYLEAVGMHQVQTHMDALTAYARETLGQLEGVTLYGHAPTSSAVVSFNLKDIHPHDLTHLLDQEAIAVRAGHHCAQPVMRALGVPATNRVSFHIYNTPEDIDLLAEALQSARAFMTGG